MFSQSLSIFYTTVLSSLHMTDIRYNATTTTDIQDNHICHFTNRAHGYSLNVCLCYCLLGCKILQGSNAALDALFLLEEEEEEKKKRFITTRDDQCLTQVKVSTFIIFF